MKVLVATRRGQGRTDDFFWGVEGELVRLPMIVCASPRCGCDRSVAGLATSRASTTFTSIERPELDPDTYRTVFLDAIEREGWLLGGTDTVDFDEVIEGHIDLAARVPAGAVLRVRSDSEGSTIEA